MLLLSLETTCDETAAAVLNHELRILSSVVASQDELHARFQGVVPEIAARAHLERMLPVIDEALRRAGVELGDIGLLAVAHTPGLAGSLLIGLAAAKTLSLVLNIPLVGVNHLYAHIYACRLAGQTEIFPCVGLIASGGHSHLYHCRGPVEFQYLGGTIDDAAGEAFDKVASMLGLPFPGGPALSQRAECGTPTAYAFPRPFLRDTERLDFSFSGLKTAVRYALVGPGKQDWEALQLSDQQINDVAASFQEAVVECLVGKSLLALKRTGLATLCVGGGVAANKRLRELLEQASTRENFRLHIAPPSLCTDNAVMGAIAIEQFQAGQLADLSLDVLPGLQRGPA